MTDKELLALAAKAAGYHVDIDSEANGFFPNGYDDDGNVSEWWNPLTDDGDALRLAVKLQLTIDVCDDDFVQVYAQQIGDQVIECDVTDTYASTRRAIVRAAAAIGMEKQKAA